LTPILSQGDLNALALAIFLGLATAGNETSTFDFLILDDPSQSLGADHKKHLAKLLAHVARHKKLIVSTMDTEFHEYLVDCMTRGRGQYHFGKWTPDEGPTITMEDLADANNGASRDRSSKPRLERARR